MVLKKILTTLGFYVLQKFEPQQKEMLVTCNFSRPQENNIGFLLFPNTQHNLCAECLKRVSVSLKFEIHTYGAEIQFRILKRRFSPITSFARLKKTLDHFYCVERIRLSIIFPLWWSQVALTFSRFNLKKLCKAINALTQKYRKWKNLIQHLLHSRLMDTR